MNPKNTLMLVVLASGLFAFIYFYESKQKPPAPVVARALPGLKAGEITSVTIEPWGESVIRVERTNGVWRLTRPMNYALQPGVVEAFLRTLEDLVTEAHLSPEDLAGRPGTDDEYGLGSPMFSIVVQQGMDERRLKLGKPNPPGDQIYTQEVGPKGGINLVAAKFAKSIPRKADEWRDTTFVDFANLAFDRLMVVNGASYFELQRGGSNELWQLTRPMPARADNGMLKMKLAELQAMRVNRFVPDGTAEKAESFGLRPPQLELIFSQGTNPVLSLQFGRNPTNDTNQIYARSSAHGLVVQVSREPLIDWRAGAGAFRNRRLVSYDFFPPADQIPFDEIQVSGREGQEGFSLRLLTNQTNWSWVVTDGQNRVFPADLTMSKWFLDNLFELVIVPQSADGQLEQIKGERALPEFGLAPPVRRSVVRKTGVGRPGTTAPIVIAQADFGLTNTNTNNSIATRYARRSDLPTDERTYIYEVKVEDFQKLPSTALELRNRRVWNQDVTNVTKVTFLSGGRTVEWKRKSQYVWTPSTGASGLTDHGTIDQMGIQRESAVDNLASLEAGRWVERAPQDRGRFELSGDTHLVVNLEIQEGDKTITRTVEFGGNSLRDPRGRYGSVKLDDDAEWVFEYSAEELKQLDTWFSISKQP